MSRSPDSSNGEGRSTADVVERAVRVLNSGGPVLLRPPEGSDLPSFVVVAAEHLDAEGIDRLARLGQGQIYLALSHEQCERLGLEMQTEPRPGGYHPVDAIDAIEGIGSGLSAEDRVRTIKLASSPVSSMRDFVKPGHVVPLRAAQHGVLKRSRPTEAAVDLIRACGDGEGAVISPLLDPGARDELAGLVEVGVEDVAAHRWRSEQLVSLEVAASIPTPAGDFRTIAFQEAVSERLHLAFVHGNPALGRDVLVSAHRECLLGDHLKGRLCHCANRLEEAVARTQAEGGVLLYSQIPPGDRAENPLASCAEARRLSGKPAAATDPIEPRLVGQILRELKIESARWLGEPPRDPGFPISSLTPYANGGS